MPAFARHRLPRRSLFFLADHCQHIPAKRNLRLASERTIAKIFQNHHRPSLRVDARALALFLQSAILFTKTTSFKSKNVVFIYLIFNKLNIICSCFSRKDFVCLSAEI